MRRFAILLAVLLWPLSASAQHYYSTNFPLTETPISEGGKWVNGGSCNNSTLCAGLDWTNINTTAKVKAYGTTPSTNPEYNDSTAVLQGIGYTWGPNQGASGVVYMKSPGNDYDPEVEIRLNTTIAAHSITGYECSFSVKASGEYFGFARWNGPLNNFTPLGPTITTGLNPIQNGDTISCENINGNISAYHNGVLIETVTDTTYTGGSPGIGTDTDSNGSSPGGGRPNGLFGFSSFQARDTAGNTRPSGANYTNPAGAQFSNFSRWRILLALSTLSGRPRLYGRCNQRGFFHRGVASLQRLTNTSSLCLI